MWPRVLHGLHSRSVPWMPPSLSHTRSQGKGTANSVTRTGPSSRRYSERGQDGRRLQGRNDAGGLAPKPILRAALRAVPSPSVHLAYFWDGRKDGFSALVNYHKLDHKSLENLTYSYLSDWFTAQSKSDKAGADSRLGAAQELQAKLKLILAGEQLQLGRTRSSWHGQVTFVPADFSLCSSRLWRQGHRCQDVRQQLQRATRAGLPLRCGLL